MLCHWTFLYLTRWRWFGIGREKILSILILTLSYGSFSKYGIKWHCVSFLLYSLSVEPVLSCELVLRDHPASLHGWQITKWEINKIRQKNWSYENYSQVAEDKKKVVLKGQFHEILSLAHRRINHRGWQITSRWINKNYSEVNSEVINLFVASCHFHTEQQSITSQVKMVEKPLQSLCFLSLLEIDLMDFRNCLRDCREPHTWAVSIMDHHTKYVYVSPLLSKTADEVLRVIKICCDT